MSRVLVISPHPDDESIGCGGTLRRHVVQGDVVQAIFLTSGEKGGHGRSIEETGQIREREAAEAVGILGITRFEFWRQPDGAFRATHQMVDRLRATIEEWEPQILYVTHDGEMLPDHRAAARLVRRLLTASQSSAVKPIVRMYEVWTPLQQMDEIVDISPYIEVKRAAILAHKSQCDVVRFHEAALGLNRYRGELHSWPGGDYAEVFMRVTI
jgi:N-acetylglucosamine malate deacetylase 1